MREPALTVLVLAGGSLAGKTLGPSDPIWTHPLLLPAGSGLAIHAIARFYAAGAEPALLRVVVDELPPAAMPLRGLSPDQLLAITPQPHILGTLLAGLADVTTPWVLINPITTLPSQAAELRCQIQVGDRLLIRENWSAVRELPDHSWRFEGKNEPAGLEPAAPFTGILIAPTPVLRNLLEQVPVAEGFDLLRLGELLVQKAAADVVRCPWHDLGHRTTHATSRRSRLPSRAFNRIRHCAERDVIVKSSSDRNRLAAERDYLQALPPALRRHFPTVLPGRHGEEQALVMEAIPFPSLAELHLHWDLGPNAWWAILERLAAIQADFGSAAPIHQGSSSWLYGAKLAQRWQAFVSDPTDPSAGASHPPWWEREICLNGRWMPPLAAQVSNLLTALQPLEANSQLQWIHGDFCFNNILCDPLYTAIRLIDARGEAAPGNRLPVGYGDSRYDRVKLHHSIAGHYDAIVNDLFQLRWLDQQHVELEIYCPPHQSVLEQAFETLMLSTDLHRSSLQLLTASLFFSMLPLHGEDPERQVALATRGMLMLSEATS